MSTPGENRASQHTAMPMMLGMSALAAIIAPVPAMDEVIVNHQTLGRVALRLSSLPLAAWLQHYCTVSWTVQAGMSIMRMRTDVRCKIEKWAGQCLDEGQACEEVCLAHPTCCNHLGLHARKRTASRFIGKPRRGVTEVVVTFWKCCAGVSLTSQRATTPCCLAHLQDQTSGTVTWEEEEARLQHGQHDLPAAKYDAACPEECLPPEQHLHNGMKQVMSLACAVSPCCIEWHLAAACTLRHSRHHMFMHKLIHWCGCSNAVQSNGVHGGTCDGHIKACAETVTADCTPASHKIHVPPGRRSAA